ncbi:UNVERIFIED_CONTAM: hypothetical protein Sradi_2762100 [Sesamum radiatum]|uniref:Phylloplanin-like n=1 Tax=Sesamum radiatum TaxID=300843 RepID=A0AAW2SAS7_SESRA
MALKSLLLFSLLIAGIAVPLAEAQLGGILGPLLGLFRIQGILYCTPNGNIGVNATATPVFPTAMWWKCGLNCNNKRLWTIFYTLDPVNFLLSTLVSGCKLVVNTPLASCNASLPSVGGLVSNLQFIGSTLTGLLNVGTLIPSGFQFNANVN